MSEEGICVGCGCDCLGTVECNCTQEIGACEECRESDMNLVCGTCRDRAVRVVPVGGFPCRGFMEDEAGMERDLGGRLPVTVPVGTWGPP